MLFTDYQIEKLNGMKKQILKKKILMSFVINNYSLLDRLIRYLLMCVAGLSIILSIFVQIIETTENVDNSLVIALNVILLFLIKLKEHIKYDKIKDCAKDQSIKYSEIYEEIERELPKKTQNAEINDGRGNSPDDFIYYINIKLINIEINDPEISNNIQQKFVLECKKKGIEIEDDFTLLQSIDDKNHSDSQLDKTRFAALQKEYDNNVALLWALDRLKDL